MGLNLKSFLTDDAETPGGKRAFLKNWKKDGDIVVWLSTQADLCYPVWSHIFHQVDTRVDDRSGEEKEFLRFRKFVSPEAEVVLKSQYFREQEDGDRLRIEPLQDPFLKLREWLRLDCDLPLDTPVFKWSNPKTDQDIIWRRGKLARLTEATKTDWGHTLDAKKEYYFVVCDNNNIDKGLQLARVTKSLGDAMREEITKQLDSEDGNDGDPQEHPYAFKWQYDESASIAKKYTAFRFNRAKMTDEIAEVIHNEEFPNPQNDTEPGENDMGEIRAAMEAAAQIDLPYDMLFDPSCRPDDDVEGDDIPF